MSAPDPEAVEQWTPARLIPAAGIRGAKEQEERATSALLAVMSIVPSFGKNILKTVDAPAGTMTTYTEPRFETDDGGTARPDGAILVDRGRTHWSCLLEVKTGKSALDAEQVDRYLAIANRDGFDALLTISNEITSGKGASPVKVDKRRIKKVKLGHISWFRILTEAVTEYEHHGVDDPEQSYILGQLIAYLDDDRSGAAGFEGMGSEWVRVRDAARNKTLRARDPGVREIAEDWAAFVEYMALRLRQRLGGQVAPVYPRTSIRADRLDEYAESLGTDGLLEATIKVPDAVANIEISADLGSRQVTTHARIKAPSQGFTKTRINWLLRQLKDVPDDLRITGRFARTSKTASLMLPDVRKDSTGLVLASDPKRELVAFDVGLSKDMGNKGGKTKGSFVAETMAQVSAFYGEVLQDIQAWQPKAPRLKEEPEEPDESAPEPVVASLPDQPEPVDEPEPLDEPEPVDSRPPAFDPWPGRPDG